MNTDDELYGRGPGYPFALGPSGGVVESAGADKIEQSIRLIIGTQHGERVMRPTFGCNLRSLAFAPNDAATANLARHLVETGLSRWEPRIELADVEVTNSAESYELTITVHYRVRGATAVRSSTLGLSLGDAS